MLKYLVFVLLVTYANSSIVKRQAPAQETSPPTPADPTPATQDQTAAASTGGQTTQQHTGGSAAPGAGTPTAGGSTGTTKGAVGQTGPVAGPRPTAAPGGGAPGVGLQGRSASNRGGSFGGDGGSGFLTLPSGYDQILREVRTGFTCETRSYGYYADTNNDCKIFHVCVPSADGGQPLIWSFMCGNGTSFNQQYLVCDYEENIVCSDAEKYYSVNDNFFRTNPDTEQQQQQRTQQQPIGQARVTPPVAAPGRPQTTQQQRVTQGAGSQAQQSEVVEQQAAAPEEQQQPQQEAVAV